MFAIYILCLLTWSAVPGRCERTEVAFKREIDGYYDTISLTASTFLELIRDSKVFIDNTLLIADLVKNLPASRTMLWLAPSKWGKSVNLNMVKTFFQMNINESGTKFPRKLAPAYQLFTKSKVFWDYGKTADLQKPLLISKEKDLIEVNYGSSPVIHISFKNATGSNPAIIKHRIQMAIRGAFEEYRYVVEQLEAKKLEKEKELKIFKRYLSGNDTWSDIRGSIPLLCKVVGEEVAGNDKSVIILIDDYDTPIVNYLLNDYPLDDDLNDVFRFLMDLIPFTFNHKYTDKYLRFAIVAGRFKIEYHEYDEEYYIADKDETFSEYFGFIEDHVRLLVSRHNINPMQAKQAFQWYCGYVSLRSKKQFCNPSSIAKYVQSKRMDSYFREDQDDLFLLQIFKNHPTFLDTILFLLSKRTAEIQRNVELKFRCRPDFKMLCDSTPKIDANSTQERKKFLTYLLGEGFLGRTTMPEEVHFPNLETTAHIAELVISFYRREHNIKQNFVRNAAVRLRDAIRENGSLSSFEDHMTVLYSKIFNKTRKAKNLKAVTEIFNCVGIQLQSITKFVMEGYYFSMVPKSNVIIVDKKTDNAVVMEIAYDSMAEEAFKLAEANEGLMKNSTTVNTVRLVGINISPNGTARTVSKFLTKVGPPKEENIV